MPGIHPSIWSRTYTTPEQKKAQWDSYLAEHGEPPRIPTPDEILAKTLPFPRRSGSSPGAVPEPSASLQNTFDFPPVQDVSRLTFVEVYKGLPELFGWTVCHGESPTPLEAHWEEIRSEFDQFISDDPARVRDHLVETLGHALGAVWTEDMDAPIFPGAPRPFIDRGAIAPSLDHCVSARATPRPDSLVQTRIGYWESRSRTRLDGAVSST